MTHRKQKKHRWGGSWTEEKLNAFSKYVGAYLTIMNKHRNKYRWQLIYFDGFAGSGSREEDHCSDTIDMFEEFGISVDDTTIYKGAAERVLSIEQEGFDFYYFIDKNEESSNALEQKLTPFRAEGKKLEFRCDDANSQLAKLAEALKDKKYKALVLLDPFGMQVNWDSISALAGTGTDLWILIPTGVVINRLLDKKGQLTHIDKLTDFLGMTKEEIEAAFYERTVMPTLFGDIEEVHKKQQPIEKIAQLYIQRLNTIFTNVTSEPLVMRNSKNNPIYHFAFASNNSTAVSIASDIIGSI